MFSIGGIVQMKVGFLVLQNFFDMTCSVLTAISVDHLSYKKNLHIVIFSELIDNGVHFINFSLGQ